MSVNGTIVGEVDEWALDIEQTPVTTTAFGVEWEAVIDSLRGVGHVQRQHRHRRRRTNGVDRCAAQWAIRDIASVAGCNITFRAVGVSDRRERRGSQKVQIPPSTIMSCRAI